MNFPRPALLPYFTAGWPDPASFLASVRGAAAAGCPAFEVGFPFTDPVADGPVIQRTSTEALEAGVDIDACFELTRRAVSEAGIPAVVMTYANLVWSPGPEVFCRRAAQAGAGALIVPDLPLEEGDELERAARQAGLDLVYLCAPTSTPERVELLAGRTRGFLYLVSVRGVTGDRRQLPDDLDALIARARAVSPVPVFVGFGISTPEQAGWVASRADGVIVGSALLRHIRELPPGEIEAGVRDFLASLLEGMKVS